MLLHLLYVCYPLFDHNHTIVTHFVFLFFVFVFVFIMFIFLCIFFITFIVFLIWKGIFVWVNGKKNTNFGLILRINSKPVFPKVLDWPWAGSPEYWETWQCFSPRKTPLLRSTSALLIPGCTQARPSGSWSGKRLLQQPGLSFVPPRPLQYLCKRGRALCQHCHSLYGHWALHTHLFQLEGKQSQLCVQFCLSFQLPDLNDSTYLFSKICLFLLLAGLYVCMCVHSANISVPVRCQASISCTRHLGYRGDRMEALPSWGLQSLQETLQTREHQMWWEMISAMKNGREWIETGERGLS